MKIKLLTTAVLAALYSAGSLHAAIPKASTLSTAPEQLQAVNVDVKKLRQQAQQQNAYSVLQNDGLNVQLGGQKHKFVYEKDIRGEHVYIVQLRQPALTEQTYSAQTVQDVSRNSGKLFTAGRAINREVENLQAQLIRKQNDVLADLSSVVGGAKARQRYTAAINGFSLTLTQDQAAAVAGHPSVLSVQRSKIYQMHTDAGPELIEADQVWQGTAPGSIAAKGEGLIVGVIDSGINSDHPSFAAVAGDGYTHVNPFGSGVYVGDCTLADYAERCNDKLIGIRSYDVLTNAYTSGELGNTSAPIGEDYHGHGSHVASTVAGNVLYNAPLVVPEPLAASDGTIVKDEFFSQVSGVAPRANIISYQVCQPAADTVQGCPGEALVAGIEDAIKDGVDVINFSIGGQDSHPWSDAVEMAFLSAREAGILVAAAAGNSGQLGNYEEYFGAIDHASPWLLNVAATTHDRSVIIETVANEFSFVESPEAGSRLPPFERLVGGALNNSGVTGVVLKAEDYPNVAGQNDQYCGEPYAAGTFDYYPDGSAIVDSSGQPLPTIVVCARNDLNDPNGIARTAKADNVKAGGADGFVLYNLGYGDPIAATSAYSVPAIHITSGAWFGDYTNNYYGLSSWLRNNGKGHVMSIQPTLLEQQRIAEDADWLAPFSSRGPSPSTPGSLIPTVAAPGVNIYAAWSDEHPFTQAPATSDFTFLSGTSMASPHAAGALALLKQVHPEWTASEIQSALVSTADETVTFRYFNRANGEIMAAETYRAGNGRINVANAVNAGLIMDETADNFLAADPQNGGAVDRLNLPQLVNFSCKPVCSWLRTVTATTDGTWKIDVDEVRNWAFDPKQQTSQNGVTVTAHPTEFSLRAGETQTIVVTASVMDTQDWFSNSEVELHSTLRLTEVSDRASAQHWPIAFKYDNNGMPSNLDVLAHRANGNQTFNNLALPEGQNVGRVFAPVKANQEAITVPKDDERYFPYSLSGSDADPADRLDEATHVKWVNVPTGSKRFMAEVIGPEHSAAKGTSDVGNLIVYVGKDYNGNGQVEMDDEIVCMSQHIIYNNFCNINAPEAGDYWVVFYNPQRGWSNQEPLDGLEETFKVATAVVSDQVATNMTVEVPYADGSGTSVDLNWSLPDAVEGDIYYSLLDFGTSDINAGNVGKVALKLVRGKNDVSLRAGQSAAKRGDIVPFTFDVLANNTGRDRAFAITAEIPEGLKVLRVGTSQPDTAFAIEQKDNQVLISGIQPNTRDVSPDYHVTTNLTNAQCVTPNVGNSNPGGYIDLAEFNITPIMGGFAPVEYDEDGYVLPGRDGDILHNEGVVIPVIDLYSGAFDSVHLYNNTDYLNLGKKNGVEIRATGMISFTEYSPLFGPFHFAFPNGGHPYEQVAPLWRAVSMETPEMMSVPFYPSPYEPEGISVASTQSGWAIIEYDNARSYAYAGRAESGENLWEERDDRFDFQLIFNALTKHGAGDFELIMAYDNIDFGSQDGRGSIGLQGYRGPIHTFGPLEGFLGKQFALENLDDVLHDGLVVCYDYIGPEVSEFDVTLVTEVMSSAVGNDLTVTAVSSVEGMDDISMSKTLSAPGNITIGAINDKTIDENTSLEDLAVYYVDAENSVNEITVTGENISAEVHGHESGAKVTITPTEHFHGATEVTVTVTDVENPSDMASTSFMLTVVSDGEEPPTTGDGDGDGTEPPQVSTSSSQFGVWMLALFGVAWLRRRLR